MSDRTKLQIAIPVGETATELLETHAIGAAVRRALKLEGDYSLYATPGFTQRLLDHFHRAKKKALGAAEE
jgi:hypothetical protein